VRRSHLWLAVALAAVIMLIIHPWLFGLPGRIESIRFRAGLHEGMTRAQVRRLIEITHGDTSISVTPMTEFQGMRQETEAGVTLVHFIDMASLCEASGPLYHLRFDRDGRLGPWTVTSWVNVC
jgi:hypothetical protein